MTEAKLIKQAKRHARDAQAELYKKYKRYWFTICLRYQTNRFNAEDALQNGLVKIFSKLHQFDARKGDFKTWSARVVVNENLLLLRNQKTTDELPPAEMLAEEENKEPAAAALSQEKLTKLIQQLPKGYRTVFNLYVLEGYNHREIAEMLDISEGTSKSQLHKARKLLQNELEVLL